MSFDNFDDPDPYSPQPGSKKGGDNTTKVLLIVLIAVFGGGILVCGGIGYFVVQALNNVGEQFGDIDWDDILDEEDAALADMIRDDAEVKDEVGDVETVTTDYEKTDTETSEDDDYMWHKVVGSDGEAWLITEFSMDDDRMYNPQAELVKADGTRVKVTLADVPYEGSDERAVYMLVKDEQRVTDATGEITSVSLDWDRTDEETSDLDADYWYLVTGEKGNVAVLTNEDDEIVIQKIELPDKSTFVP